MTPETVPTADTHALPPWLWGLPLAAALWVAVYGHLTDLADLLVSAAGLSRATHWARRSHFFLYDTPKVLLLLTGIVFLMGVIQTFFAPERTRALLAGRRLGIGNAMAASLGIVTPFCSCSAVPLFIGFLSAGVPLGITFSFLIAAPMVNEIALALLLGLFGWKVAALYLGMGLLIAIVAGLIIGELKMERLSGGLGARHPPGRGGGPQRAGYTWVERFEAGLAPCARDRRPGLALCAGRHRARRADPRLSCRRTSWPAFMGRDVWWAVPAAVVLGVPMYTNAAGILPIVEALIGKGAALGTTLAFMMSVIALSAPEMLILRKVLKWPLIATFIGVVATGILLVGYVFNLVL